MDDVINASGGMGCDTSQMGTGVLPDIGCRRHPRLHRHFGRIGRCCPHPVLHLCRDLPGAVDSGAYDIQGVADAVVIASSASDEAIHTVSSEIVWIASLRSQ